MFTADCKGIWMTPFISDSSINISSGLCADGIFGINVSRGGGI